MKAEDYAQRGFAVFPIYEPGSGRQWAPIPAELRERRQWVGWRLGQRTGEPKPTKLPVNPHTGRLAATDDPATWGTFEEALAAVQGYELDGVGYVFSADDPYTGVDLDGCRDPHTGAIEPWAKDIIDRLDSYTEISPSGTGVHIISRALLPADHRRKGSIEMYDCGRYFTMTGNVNDVRTTIEDRQAEIDALHREIFGEPARKPAPVQAPQVPTIGDDRDLIDRAMSAANGARFEALWSGDTTGYTSTSEADLALVSLIAFYTGPDPARIDRLFRQSALCRGKWDRTDYRERTIEVALAGRTDFYSPNSPSSWRRDLITPTMYTNGRRPPAADSVKTDALPRSLAEVVATFKKWLYIEDPAMIYVGLGAIAANYMAGDPTWLMFVSASSSGKTETLNAVSRLPHVYMAATMTEAALLSGSPKRERDSTSTGGLLRTIGDFGILLCKDFTSVLSMHRDTRAGVLAALREVYDGAWTRHVGVDGGRTLEWTGKLGLLACCTAAIDSHHSVMATMGERFLLFRLPDVDPLKQARKALANAGRERELRRELSEAVSGLFATLALPESPPALHEDEIDRLIALASLVARARSAVERDGHTREIELILDPEAPARIVQALRRLYGGLLAIGVDWETAQRLIIKVGLDCLPKIRRSVFDLLVKENTVRDTTTIAAAIGYPSQTARRALEDLTVHGVVTRQSAGPGRADTWALSPWASAMYSQATTFPEKSDDGRTAFINLHKVNDDISGKVPVTRPCHISAVPVEGADVHEECELEAQR